jgi:hypothetical protein
MQDAELLKFLALEKLNQGVKASPAEVLENRLTGRMSHHFQLPHPDHFSAQPFWPSNLSRFYRLLRQFFQPH